MLKILITMLVSILLIDPSDKILHAKTPVFILLLIVWCINILFFKKRVNIKTNVILIVGIIMLLPLPSVIGGYMSGEIYEIDQWLPYYKTFFLISLLFLVVENQTDIESIIVKTSILVSILTIITWLISFFYPETYILLYNFLCLEKETIIMSQRNNYGLEMTMVFYKTSPVLIYPISFYLTQIIEKKITFKNVVVLLIHLLAVFISATRANLIATLLVLIFILIRKIEIKKIIILFFMFLACTITLLTSQKVEKSADNTMSDDIKAGHIQSIFELFSQKKYIILIGQGPGSFFFSKGTLELTNKTEVTYLEFIRIFGIPIFVIFMIIVLKPFYDYTKGFFYNKEYLIVSYGCYLLIAVTNPLLISSTGFLVVTLMLSIKYIEKKPYL